MAFKFYTSDKTSERCFPWLWFVRLVQMLVTIIVLAIAASSASDFTSLSCSVPSKLAYTIAAAVLSFLVLLVLIFSTGPTGLFRVVPWLVWGQLALDIFMLIIWIAAAGVSQYTCSDLCNACPAYDEVWTAGIYCYCSSYYIYKRDQSPAPRGLTGSIEQRAYYRNTGPGSSKKNAKTAFDSIMVILFAFTTAATIFWIFKNRRSGAAAAASTSSPPGNTAQQPGGLQPTPAPGYPAPDGQGITHNQGTAQGTSYSPQQTQPQMQQSGYSEPMQQPTYPTANPQGSASDYYNQPQSQPEQTNYPPNRAEMPSPPPQQRDVSPITAH
ncbi:MAG: hypothetical protein L6R38_004570 [Xanthoria sp. 2 TBL-2021]|nr:MAG: hypothetical protein L6R38_004570 [Xanthoria sp. 2 TBL-2021]